jgi:hypothetical protein
MSRPHWSWRGRPRGGTPPPAIPNVPRKGNPKAPGGARPRQQRPKPAADCIYAQVGQIIVAYDGERVHWVILACAYAPSP